MKKIKLLAPILSIGALTAGTMPLITSCQNGGSTDTTITPTIEAEHGTAVASEIRLNKQFKIAYAPEEGYLLNAVTIKVGDKTLTETTDYEISGNVITVKASAVNKNTVSIKITAKQATDPYVNDHTYLEEAMYIKATVNATSHDIRFSLKNALTTGQTLKATITESDDFGEKILTSTTYDLTGRVFGNVFYAPVHYKTTYVSKTVMTKFDVKIECVTSTNAVVWTDTFKDLYIKFIALNAWAGADYRGYTTDITRMDNFHFTKHLRGSGVVQARTMPFPIELRNSPKESGSKLRAKIYDVQVLQNGQPKNDIFFGLLSEAVDENSRGCWVRKDWDSTKNYFNYEWSDADKNDIRRDKPTYSYFDTTYDINVGFYRANKSQLQPTDDRVYANFNLVVYEVDDNDNPTWHEVFEGCRLTYIDPTSNN